MATVPWQAVIDELRLIRSDMAQAHYDHNQRMGAQETQLQVLQTVHEQRMDAMQRHHDEQMQAHATRLHRLDEIAGNHAERLAKAEETLERITVIWNRLNNPETNGH